MIDLPKTFLDRMHNMLNDEFKEFLDSYNFPSYKALRVNTLKNVDIKSLTFKLEQVDWCKEGYYYFEDKPGKHVYHEQGLYYIQEPSAMAVVEELDVKNGDLVLDLCAAPGGKSTQIACKLNGTGYLVSNEIIPQRAKILASNIERMGITNAIVLNESVDKLERKFKNYFNKILVDAPCSGEGMFRKNNDAILEWSEENVSMCAARQLQILEAAAKMAAENARIVFSTCTFSMIENESVVEKFLQLHKEFKLVETKNKFTNGYLNLSKTQRLYPHKVKGEGHFIAVLDKNNVNETINVNLNKKPLKQDPTFTKFVKESLNINLEYDTNYNNNLYICPNINLDGIKVVRHGLHLGEIKKSRFEPSHTLALALKKEHFKNIIELDENDINVKKYLRGETIQTDKKGWSVIVVNNNPLGWVKSDGYQAKNHYPKGLRKEL